LLKQAKAKYTPKFGDLTSHFAKKYHQKARCVLEKYNKWRVLFKENAELCL